MSSQEQYVTITHYKEREFYFLNYAIQTEEGIIPKEIEQFHESEKEKFIEKIKALQSKYPKHHVVSISLLQNQTVGQKEVEGKVSAKIFKNHFVTQEEIDTQDIPTTLYFSPFTIIYQQYKSRLNENTILLIGLFDRKLFMMFATANKIHQSWIIGTRGLTEKQVADRLYKSMQAYNKIFGNPTDYIEMLVSDDSPKLLKVLREELSLHIELHQNNIHNLLHYMASNQKLAESSYIKSFKKIELSPNNRQNRVDVFNDARYGLNDIIIDDLNRQNNLSLRSIFSVSSLSSAIPLIIVVAVGIFFSVKNDVFLKQISQKDMQIKAQKINLKLANTSEKLFKAIGKNGELKEATISTTNIDLVGIVWGIEPLKNSLLSIHKNGKFSIKPLENFMTEFSFTAKL